ncbi:hypothetical protein BVC80_1635g5 [Macleaya cordata]|uniref:AAA+ ATPase At3g28540-like C-terminal domain-containing protein n=1 Tax=Macleaya cordata TaxID=56857 RepID=A0A200Q6Z0_MACCD|nr:hypothetical protein BVC80_1635g5 [Macleaya cordata]
MQKLVSLRSVGISFMALLGLSIIVIEDIDCSLNLTGKRKKKKEEKDNAVEKGLIREMANEEGDNDKDNFRRLIQNVGGRSGITCKHLNDPALIQRGRMDIHIEMSYCGFEGFKILAKNYLDLDSHHLFETIRHLINDIQMSHADVAENLMPKTISRDPEACLKSLIQGLAKAEEDERLKAEEEAKEKDLSNKSGEVKKGVINLLRNKLKRMSQLGRKMRNSKETSN